MAETVITASGVANPSLSVSAPAAGTAGGPIAASSVSASLTGGAAPSGSLSFKVFGPQAAAPSSCTSGGTAVGGDVGVSGNGTYNPAADFTPPSAGDYWWYASYGGDSANNPAASACGAAMAETVIETAPGGGGGGGGPPPTQTPSTQPPSCTLSVKSKKVLLPPTHKGAKKRKNPKGKPGTLQFLIGCDQAASVTLSGRLTEVIKTRHAKRRMLHGHHKPHTKTLALAAIHTTVAADSALTLTVKLPEPALTALARRIHESALFTLAASNANGTAQATAKIARLVPIRS